jgi:hypothetical protein
MQCLPSWQRAAPSQKTSFSRLAGRSSEARWPGLDPTDDIGVPEPRFGGLYLKPPLSGGLCERRDDDPIGQACSGPAVIDEGGVRILRAAACIRRALPA